MLSSLKKILAYVARRYSEYRINSAFGEHLSRLEMDLADINEAREAIANGKYYSIEDRRRRSTLLANMREQYRDPAALRDFISENRNHPSADVAISRLGEIDASLWFYNPSESKQHV